MLTKLPIETNRKIIIEFLFIDFIKCFKKLFEFRKWQSSVMHNYHTFNDLLYSNFMLSLVENLIPLNVDSNQIILSELDEVMDVFFVCNGFYDIGYEMNKKLRFIMRQTKSTVIGGFEVLYDRRSHYIYRAHTNVSGYFIRKKPFKDMSNEYPEFIQNIRRVMLG
jgi:CRP-like cAMP-binding protein